MINVTIETFNKEVLEHKGVVAVKFFRANGCKNCETMKPVFEELETVYPDVKCVEINADENKELPLPATFKVLPAILFYDNGEFIGHTEGVVAFEQLRIPLMPTIELKAIAYDLSDIINRAEVAKRELQQINGFIARRNKK
jgi:thiol-disulfide isomerase/thioredoxin